MPIPTPTHPHATSQGTVCVRNHSFRHKCDGSELNSHITGFEACSNGNIQFKLLVGGQSLSEKVCRVVSLYLTQLPFHTLSLVSLPSCPRFSFCFHVSGRC